MTEWADRIENELEVARIAELQAQLAYEAAASIIESCSVPIDGGWSDVSPGLDEEMEADQVEDAMEYLDLIGLLEVHPEHENWAKVLEAPEGAPVSARVITIPNRMVECATGCGRLVVGEFICRQCRADAELREKARARVFRQLVRYELGVTPFPPPPMPPDRPSLHVRCALACVATGLGGLAVMAAWFLGKLAILWLCRVSA